MADSSGGVCAMRMERSSLGRYGRERHAGKVAHARSTAEARLGVQGEGDDRPIRTRCTGEDRARCGRETRPAVYAG